MNKHQSENQIYILMQLQILKGLSTIIYLTGSRRNSNAVTLPIPTAPHFTTSPPTSSMLN